MFLKVKKIVGLSAGLILVVAGFIHAGLQNTYVTYPRTPNQEEGRTVPYKAKGIVVYITEEQEKFLSWLMWIEIGSGMVAALVILVHRGDPFKSRK